MLDVDLWVHVLVSFLCPYDYFRWVYYYLKKLLSFRIRPFPLTCFHILFGTMASADFCLDALLSQFARLRLGLFQQISHGKRSIVPVKTARFTTPRLRLAMGRPCPMPGDPEGKPYILFLFVSSHFCRLLPSDSSSRRTPLHLANDSR